MMTVDEYAAATNEIKELQSRLAESEIKMIHATLNPLQLQRIETLRRRAALDRHLGPQRLAAATAEAADWDRRQNQAKKAQHDHPAKQHKDDTTQTRPHAPRASAAPATREAGQEALSSSSARSRTVSDSRPVRRAHSAAA